MGASMTGASMTGASQLLVHTGNGKGKTSAAFGTALRAVGWGQRVCFIQFVKGKWLTGERKFAKDVELMDFHVMGKGFTWESADLAVDRKAAQSAWQIAAAALQDERYKLVVLDELTYICHFAFVPVAEVAAALAGRHPDISVIVTGRNCPKEILDIADLISEVRNIRHPFMQGKTAVKGIDY